MRTRRAIGFRFRGNVDANATWVELKRTALSFPSSGFSVKASAAVYQLNATQEDWLVTSFGFGRQEFRMAEWEIESLVFLSATVERAFVRGAAGTFTPQFTLTIPVYGRVKRMMGRASLPYQIGVGLAWGLGG